MKKLSEVIPCSYDDIWINGITDDSRFVQKGYLFVATKGFNVDHFDFIPDAINSKMQFPDRSPRPQVSFSELYHWNSKCRNINDSVIEYSSIGDESQKYALLTDWQNFLAERWVEVVLNRTIRKKEPWFNDNLRKFVLKFLEKYDRMSEKEKDEYKKFLEENI